MSSGPPDDGFDFIIDYGDSQERPPPAIPKLPFGEEGFEGEGDAPPPLPSLPPPGGGQDDPFRLDIELGDPDAAFGGEMAFDQQGGGFDVGEIDGGFDQAPPPGFDHGGFEGGGAGAGADEVDLETFPASEPGDDAPELPSVDPAAFATAPLPFAGGPVAPPRRPPPGGEMAPAPARTRAPTGGSPAPDNAFEAELRDAAQRAVGLHRELLGRALVGADRADPTAARSLDAIRTAGLADLDPGALEGLLRRAASG